MRTRHPAPARLARRVRPRSHRESTQEASCRVFSMATLALRIRGRTKPDLEGGACGPRRREPVHGTASSSSRGDMISLTNTYPVGYMCRVLTTTLAALAEP